jgi:putative ABC transport system ATP-binding protein
VPNSLISVKDLHLSLNSEAGDVHILRGLNLDIQKGETVGMVGPSGSGKSTLLMVMAGLEKPSSGSLHVAGMDFSKLDEDGLARFRRDHVGIVFQSFHLIPTMTALENVAVPLELAGRKDAFKAAEEELELVGLGHRLSHYPGQLSGGEQQRVALARAAASNPGLLLADEPTGNLDGETGRQIVDLLFDLHDRLGTTLILITHDKSLADKCNRVISLKDGLIVEERPGTAFKAA